jgi:hypothetical protein
MTNGSIERKLKTRRFDRVYAETTVKPDKQGDFHGKYEDWLTNLTTMLVSAALAGGC